MSVVWQVLYIVLMCFFVLLLARMVMDWVQFFARDWRPGRAMVVVLESIYTVTDPPLKLLRRWIPPVRIGGAALDLAFMLLIIIVLILIQVVGQL
ncbi:YggT family protein [Streptacidiphilus jiangxiensis]|uniref:YggT family protein n=1 Tax=Streptacidiphilus jiangxiensis TaxID=235985 RepID=A0A1H7SPL8_STRJI|nr:YggT family protein [Streptacidiphilus jiangxiensis]SEL73714.1 YggT family protein [Streptacidiphilus jiangxiensis]